MQLFFPTVIPIQGAEYRPPLYPIPWSLSPYDHFYFAARLQLLTLVNRNGIIHMVCFLRPNIIHTGVDCPPHAELMSWLLLLEQSFGQE